jgi:acetylglutamate kinase
VFVTDVPGVLVDGADADRIEAGVASRLIAEGAFAGGIVPKLLAAVRAARLGIRAEIGATEVVA